MKAIIFSKNGGPEVLKLQSMPDPELKEGHILIKTAASGVNFADILARKGLYPDADPLPLVVGYEVAGEITGLGEKVDPKRFKVGDRVLALTRFKGYSDQVLVPESQVFPVPENLSLEQAAAIPVNYLTAWQLAEMGGLKKDDTILIHNAGGGVGLAALDIARKRGARIIGTASESKHERLLE
ncbi:alcohol dehydrogenase catalytic domain-containing protein, partial [Balneolaceae bacterium ANBcel3]|nr:alcohol dehydrogenase catalytic domain-containing protein [Balneolaceae bacterium ANBcel3]